MYKKILLLVFFMLTFNTKTYAFFDLSFDDFKDKALEAKDDVIEAITDKTSIRKIMENPQKYYEKIVTVKGIVRKGFGIGGVGYYILTDKRDGIVVFTEKNIPLKGTQISVTGKVKQAIVIDSEQLFVIYEE